MHSLQVKTEKSRNKVAEFETQQTVRTETDKSTAIAEMAAKRP